MMSQGLMPFTASFAPFAPQMSNVKHLTSQWEDSSFLIYQGNDPGPEIERLLAIQANDAADPSATTVICRAVVLPEGGKLCMGNQFRIWKALDLQREKLEAANVDTSNIPYDMRDVPTRITDFIQQTGASIVTPDADQAAQNAWLVDGGVKWSVEVIQQLGTLSGGSPDATVDDLQERGPLRLIQSLQALSVPSCFPKDIAVNLAQRLLIPLQKSITSLIDTYGDPAKRALHSLLIALFMMPIFVFSKNPKDPNRTTRIELFEAGNFDRLIEMAYEACPSGDIPLIQEGDPKTEIDDMLLSAPEGLYSGNNLLSTRHLIMSQKIEANELSRAMQVGQSHGPPCNSDEARRQYASLVTRNLNPSELPLQGAPPCGIFETPVREAAKKCLSRASATSSGGPSRWRFSHLQNFKRTNEVAISDLINTLTSLMANDDLPSITVQQLFRMSRGVPIPKGDTSAIRPLAVGEVFRRLASSVVAHTAGQDAIQKAAGDFQFAAGTQSGTDLAGFLPRIASQLLPDHALLGVDCENAFQNISRKVVLEKVYKYLPSAAGAARALYNGPSLIILGPHETSPSNPTLLVSDEGVHQGCVFGTIFFCIAIRDTVEAIIRDAQTLCPTNGMTGFADDLVMHASAASIPLVARLTAFHLASVNLRVNPKKLVVLHKQGYQKFTSGDSLIPHPATFMAVPPNASESLTQHIPLTSADLRPGVADPLSSIPLNELGARFKSQIMAKWNVDGGITLAGTPYGNAAFMAKTVWKKIIRAFNSMRVAMDYSACNHPNAKQGGNLLVRQCVFSKLSHLARIIPLLLSTEKHLSDLDCDETGVLWCRLLLHLGTLLLHREYLKSMSLHDLISPFLESTLMPELKTQLDSMNESVIPDLDSLVSSFGQSPFNPLFFPNHTQPNGAKGDELAIALIGTQSNTDVSVSNIDVLTYQLEAAMRYGGLGHTGPLSSAGSGYAAAFS